MITKNNKDMPDEFNNEKDNLVPEKQVTEKQLKRKSP